jgi:hypothetical protein
MGSVADPTPVPPRLTAIRVQTVGRAPKALAKRILFLETRLRSCPASLQGRCYEGHLRVMMLLTLA